MLQTEGYVTTADGVRLYFQRVGTGEPTVVMPNGFYLLDDFVQLANTRTLVVYDLRNRGRSDAVADATKLERGILQDVDDLEAVRRHLGLSRVDLIGHSYVGLTVMLYAMAHPARVNRVVQIGPTGPRQDAQYPPHLMNADETLRDVFARLGELERERASLDPEAFCRKAWDLLHLICVTNPADARRLDWGRCDLANERGFRKYWMERVLPSIQRLDITVADLAKVTSPVLVVHGTRDRNAPYGGGRSWAFALPDARLVTIDDAAHAPWIEAPAAVFGSIETFLNGTWPDAAEKVDAITPSP
jgi:pimeloyl-ACP methyl ester carboxylesterase